MVHSTLCVLSEVLLCQLMIVMLVSVLSICLICWATLSTALYWASEYYALHSICGLSAVYYEAWYMGRGLVRRLLPTLWWLMTPSDPDKNNMRYLHCIATITRVTSLDTTVKRSESWERCLYLSHFAKNSRIQRRNFLLTSSLESLSQGHPEIKSELRIKTKTSNIFHFHVRSWKD